MNGEGRSCRDFQAVTICYQVLVLLLRGGLLFTGAPKAHEYGPGTPCHLNLLEMWTFLSKCWVVYGAHSSTFGEARALSCAPFSLPFFSLPFSPLFSLLLPIKPVFTSRNRGKRRGGKGGRSLLLKLGVPRIKLPGYPEAGLQPPGPYCWLLEGTRWGGSPLPMILPGGEPHSQYQAPLLRMRTPASVHVPVFTCRDCIRCGVGKFGAACQ